MDYEVPSELTIDEIKNIIEDYGTAAANAMRAGFDGVELHASLGYLPNQFLTESSNQRTDQYGGTIENRSRFILEVMEGLITAVGAEKVDIKLSPSVPINNMSDSNIGESYTYLIHLLNALPIAYIHLMQPLFPMDDLPEYLKDPLDYFGHLIKKPIITNGGYVRETAEKILAENKAQFVSFGSLFIANPDLPQRFELNANLNEVDRQTMYGGDDIGYIDYPVLVSESING